MGHQAGRVPVARVSSGYLDIAYPSDIALTCRNIPILAKASIRASLKAGLVDVDAADFAELTEHWEISLRNQHKSPRTIDSYLTGLGQFASWCTAQDIDPDLTRRNVEGFTASLILTGKSAATAGLRQIALRLFSAWLVETGELERDDLLGVKQPKLDQKVVEGLTRDEVQALIAACAGRSFTQVRDLALVRFMLATGARADEVVSMKTWDLQVGAGSAVIVRGKGGKGRRGGFGDKSAEAIARYLRARRKHPLAERPELWLAGRQRILTYDGLYTTLRRRALAAGILGFHPHRLRHTWAVSWARAGGSTTGLMAAGGWTSMEMPMRYFGSAAQELAAEEARRLRLDDF
jgi:site-specific recombinase XerD